MLKVEYTKRFLKELSELPKETQVRAEDIVFKELLTANPFSLGYVERMRGYSDKYKIRLGDYRIGITIDKQKNNNLSAYCPSQRHISDISMKFT